MQSPRFPTLDPSLGEFERCRSRLVNKLNVAHIIFRMANETHIESLQKALQQNKLDGWLFYSFRGSDPIAENILRLDHAKFTTRRWFYFVPAKGTPQKIVHAIEAGTLDSLPGDKHVYVPWQQLHEYLRAALRGVKKVAMQYSPMNTIPYISRVDAGTIELV